MEVGAVKQAFNNEVIQLKKNLNQARIQIIHKLTRKAKTFAEKKKTPEKLKRKLKKKAESAVNEVLILKKIKPRDVARFTVTHTGNLEDYLNKPTVDQDKACARLLLHKCLQEKYKIIRNTFSGIPIKDLLMSRGERLKLKRQALLDKKMKKGKKQNIVNAEGNVENIKNSKTKDLKKNTSKTFAASDSEDNENMEFDGKDDSGDEEANTDDEKANSDSEKADSDDQKDDEDENQPDNSDAESEAEVENDQDSGDNENEGESSNEEESDNEEEVESASKGKRSKFVKTTPTTVDIKQIKIVTSAITFDQLGKNRKKPEVKNPNKPKDMNKNKNLNEKLQLRKFKKKSNESQVKETKIVDPFFITATGENYMSTAEPRQPDEVKEIHKQGNRKERRAAMFGHVPEVKPRQDFRQTDSSGFRHKKQSDEGNYNRGNDGFRNRNESQFRSKNDEFRSRNDIKGRNDKPFGGRNNQFKGRTDKPLEGKNNQFKGRNDRSVEGKNDQFKGKNYSKFKGRNNDAGEPKVEKLHPSWEAKKKQSGILPFQGKKIVFDEG